MTDAEVVVPEDQTSKPSITVRQLETQAKKGLVGKAARENFFTVDEASSRPFSPAILLNGDAVNLKGSKPSLSQTTDLLNKATVGEAKAVLPKKTAAKPTAAAFKVRIYSEGDSWFNLPDLPVPVGFPFVWKRYPPDCIDILDKTFEAKPNNTAIWGDTLKNMVAGKQYLQKLKSNTSAIF